MPQMTASTARRSTVRCASVSFDVAASAFDDDEDDGEGACEQAVSRPMLSTIDVARPGSSHGIRLGAASTRRHRQAFVVASSARVHTRLGVEGGEYPCRLPSIALLALMATEDARRLALMPFEGDTEVRDVRIADAGANLFDRQASVEQEGARYLVPLRQHEGANAPAEHRLEVTLQSKGVGADNMSELVDSRRGLYLRQQAI